MSDTYPCWGGQQTYIPYGRDQVSDPPGLDCVADHHLFIRNTEPGAFVTNDDCVPLAEWCLWCGAGSSNEYIPEG